MAADFTNQYNTQLSPEEEAQFVAWANSMGKLGDVADYDLRGAWKAKVAQAGNGHFPDTFKKPNHPTFSVESQYSGEGVEGGRWVDAGNGQWQFWASPANLDAMGADGLDSYFKQAEPDVALVLPDPGKVMAATLDKVFAKQKR